MIDAPQILETRAAQGDDIYLDAIAYAMQAADEQDAAQWTLGDIASVLSVRYGQNVIEDFAKELHIGKSTMYEYRQVAQFYERERRNDYRAELPLLRYSHFRIAMRLKDPDEAYEFLGLAASNGWTVDQMKLQLKAHLGQVTVREKIGEYTPVYARFLDPQHPSIMMLRFDALEGLIEGRDAASDGEEVIVVLYREKAIVKEDKE